VFKEVQAKLKQGLVEAETELNADVNPATGQLRTRSALVINCLAAMVTALYSAKVDTAVVGCRGLRQGVLQNRLPACKA
jgi:hypothetical protein